LLIRRFFDRAFRSFTCFWLYEWLRLQDQFGTIIRLAACRLLDPGTLRLLSLWRRLDVSESRPGFENSASFADKEWD
jgi:hypothetical protein